MRKITIGKSTTFVPDECADYILQYTWEIFSEQIGDKPTHYYAVEVNKTFSAVCKEVGVAQRLKEWRSREKYSRKIEKIEILKQRNKNLIKQKENRWKRLRAVIEKRIVERRWRKSLWGRTIIVLDKTSCWEVATTMFRPTINGEHASRYVLRNLRKLEIPDGYYACHHCDNPMCIRPSHLFVGSPRDNTLDCMNKGRHWPWLELLYTEDNPNKKRLKTWKVLQILYHKHTAKNRKMLAERFGISDDSIYDIWKGKRRNTIITKDRKLISLKLIQPLV